MDHFGILSIIVFLGAKRRMCRVVLGKFLHAAEKLQRTLELELGDPGY